MTITRYPTAPELPGVEFRHLVMPRDLAGMNDVANTVRAAEGGDWVTSYEQFRAFYEHLSNCDPATDVMIAERAGRIVGYGRASWYEDLQGQRLYEPAVFAHPDEPPDLRIAIYEAMERRNRQIAATHPAGPKLFQTDAADSASAHLVLLRERGYRPVRYAFTMVRPHLDDLPDAPLPEGLEIREVRPEHLRTIFDAEVEAFRDHWGMGLPTEADYQQFLTDPVQGEYALWRVAWEGDQAAGMVRNYINVEENARYGRKRGWVENISVRRPWRRRGLARALIATSFPVHRARGMTEAALGVDTENPNGALRLYESCGFVATKREATYRKPLG
ncbi:MAG: GNAT family N-acetyltransferase [Chloroflexi bacterium]|nr:GNAT family N-acetyltransferase [Chloroflexota bacterium]